MKTLAGAKNLDFDYKSEEFAPAAFKWVLSHPEVNGLIITIKSVADLDLYLTASGKKITASDQRILNRYAARYAKEYCRTGCNTCEPSCPNGVSIATTLRHQMYFIDYGMEKHAMESYAHLKDNAGRCLDCEDDTCAGGCPYELPVSTLLREAHRTLTITV
jgi:predicted aldo/keto reductase-like oxidoreductase